MILISVLLEAVATENGTGSWICKYVFGKAISSLTHPFSEVLGDFPRAMGYSFLKGCQISNRCLLKVSGTTLHTSQALWATLVMVTLCHLDDGGPQGSLSFPASPDSTGEVRRNLPSWVTLWPSITTTWLPETASLMSLWLSQPPFLWGPILASLKSENEVAQSCLTLCDPRGL